MIDLGIVIVSANSAHWLERCLQTVQNHAGDIELEVVVVDNASTDGTRDLVETHFPEVRLISAANRGFAAGCNRGLEQLRARYLLLLNPDTEITEGTLAELVEIADARTRTGVFGVRQVRADGTLCSSIHRFPSLTRALGEALLSEYWPVHPAWAGERELDPASYEREHAIDWPTGAFMLLRHEALQSAGLLDERFFLLCEEPDLCLRIKSAGWRSIHVPCMTVVHHGGKPGVQPRMVAQEAFARKQYAHKHFPPAYRRLYLGALGARHILRWSGAHLAQADARARREGARRALRALAGRGEPPFRVPPATAIETGKPALQGTEI